MLVAGDIHAQVGGALEALGHQDRLLAGPGNRPHLALGPRSNVQPAVLVEAQAVAPLEAVGDFLDAPVGQLHAVEFPASDGGNRVKA